jgi:hypothetical protein
MLVGYHRRGREVLLLLVLRRRIGAIVGRGIK